MGKLLNFLIDIHSFCRDKPYSRYKPGQTSLQRDYYGDATQERPDGSKSLENYGRFGSDYGKNVSAAVKPGDYVVPSKDANTLGKYLLSSSFSNFESLF